MVVVDHSRSAARRHYFAALELGLMLQRVRNKFVELLRSQELIQHNASGPNRLRRIQNADSVIRLDVAMLRPLLHRSIQCSETVGSQCTLRPRSLGWRLRRTLRPGSLNGWLWQALRPGSFIGWLRQA